MSEPNPAYPWLKHYPAHLHWDCGFAPKPLYCLLEKAVERFPNNTAIDFMGRKYTFREIGELVDRFAAALQKMGVKKGVRVGIFLPNCPYFVVSYYAILKAGGTVVNFNPLYTIRDIQHEIDDAGVEIMVTLSLKVLYPKLAECFGRTCLKTVIIADMREMLQKHKGVLFSLFKRADMADVPDDERHVWLDDLLETENKPAPVDINPDEDIAVLQYTGGTTGTPKGTMLTHANLHCNTIQIGMWFDGLEDGKEIMMGVLPLFHVFAMTAIMNLSMHKGMLMILHPRFELVKVLEDIAHKKPTVMPGVPTMFNAINNSRSLDKYDLSSLKFCVSGGAPLPLEVKQQFEKLTGCKLVEGYGLSESSPVVAVNPPFGDNKAGSIGMPLPGTTLEIVHMEDKQTLMPVGEIGEICIRGPQVMRGYWNKKDETDNVLRGPRLHTGDLGYMDEQGYFFIVDRLKEMIIVGGFNVYPRNVEEIIYTHEAVLEAAVIGIVHPHRGQMVKAFVVKKPGAELTELELKQFLKDKLVPYSQPSQIEFRDALPKTLIGKIEKKVLAAEEAAKKAAS